MGDAEPAEGEAPTEAAGDEAPPAEEAPAEEAPAEEAPAEEAPAEEAPAEEAPDEEAPAEQDVVEPPAEPPAEPAGEPPAEPPAEPPPEGAAAEGPPAAAAPEGGDVAEEKPPEGKHLSDIAEVQDEFIGEGGWMIPSDLGSEVSEPEPAAPVSVEGMEDDGEALFIYEEEAQPEETLIPPSEVLGTATPESSVPTSQTLTHPHAKLSPFFTKWTFGMKKNIPLINLTKLDRHEMLFAAAHLGVIYDYRRDSMRFLPGHNNNITSTSADASGRWLVTADAGEKDTSIIVWDNEFRLPVWSMYDVFPGEGTRHVAISQDARFIAAVSWGFEPVVKFWLWTLGVEEADGTQDIGSEHGAIKHLAFSKGITELFAVTAEMHVVFCQWVHRTRRLRTYVTEIKKHQGKLGLFRETLFLEDNHTAITTTSRGQVVVWCDVEFSEPVDDCALVNIKKTYLKTIKIQNQGINSMKLVDGIIVTASDTGIICFHDQSLKLMYWVPYFRLDPLVAVSFHLVPPFDEEEHMDPFHPEFDELRSSKRSTSEEGLDVFAGEGWEGWELEDHFFPSKSPPDTARQQAQQEPVQTNADNNAEFCVPIKPSNLIRIPSDCTLELRPFPARDLIFATASGKIGYISHTRNKIRYFLYQNEAPILSIACNPTKVHMVSGNAVGRVALYNCKQKTLLLFSNLANCGITALKYSTIGHVLAAGLQTGEIMILDPIDIAIRYTMHHARSRIMQICFSPKGDFMAYYDDSNGTCLYIENEDHSWTYMGKHNAHYKPIADIMFEPECKYPQPPRLFSVGTDRMLVEYDTVNLEEEHLKLISVNRIEQTAIPLSFDWHPMFYEASKFVVSNNEFKIKTIEKETKITWKTTLGLTTDTPIRFMYTLPNWKNEEDDEDIKRAYMIFHTDKNIGLRLLPLTGNPFEEMAMTAHGEKITNLAVSYHYKHIFTTGVNDSAIIMWKINQKSVDVAQQLGGEDLDPFFPLIEGGPKGFLFQELEDFFYYAMIIHQGEDANLERVASMYLALCEIPDLLRALGYYPTDWEIDNIIYELSHIAFEETGNIEKEVLFQEYVKMYLNHRPVGGVSMEHINAALLSIADTTDPDNILLEKDELFKSLENNAEEMEHKEVMGYLCILLQPKNEKKPLPLTMSLTSFADEVLGVDLEITETDVRDVTHAFEKEKVKEIAICEEYHGKGTDRGAPDWTTPHWEK